MATGRELRLDQVDEVFQVVDAAEHGELTGCWPGRSPDATGAHGPPVATRKESSSASKNAMSCSGSGTVAASTLKPIRTVSA